MGNTKVEQEPKNPELLYKILVQRVRHCDEQVTKTIHYYVTALGALIPITTFLKQVNTAWPTYAGILVLALALAIRLFALSSTIMGEKLCWINPAREWEEKLFLADHGPFFNQRGYFDSLSGSVSKRLDNLILKHTGPVALKRVASVLFLVGLLSVISGMAFMNHGQVK